MSGKDLQNYIFSFFSQDIFTIDFVSNKFYSKIQQEIKIPCVLATIYLDFILNCND